nr:hypothetical protein [Bacilli bacterium]
MIEKAIIFISDKKYGKCLIIQNKKDLFKDIKNIKELQEKAYDYILNGNRNFTTIIDKIDSKIVQFKRISAKEYLYGTNSKNLSKKDYKHKMRIVPSIDDLISFADIKYNSKLAHESSLFGSFNNYQGNIIIDNIVLRYIVRIGKTKKDNIFYDISLEYLGAIKGIDVKVPSA